MSGMILAYPSKGRLKPHADELFAKCGLKITSEGSERSYQRSIAGMPDVQILLVEAVAVPGLLARGEAHAGITGVDLVAEHLPDRDHVLETPLPLAFGAARIALAVPQCWIDVADLADLDETAFQYRRTRGRRMRIATGFRRLARQFLVERCAAEFEIVPSRGPTEAAPLAGLAEAVVDIVSSGQTLAANALKPIEGGEILKSEACLYVSRTAEWSESIRNALDRLRSQLEETVAEMPLDSHSP